MVVRVTIAISPELQYKANQLALCLGTVPADNATFGERKTANGFYYAGVQAPDHWVAASQLPAVAPGYAPDADVTAAREAQSVMDVYTPETAQPAQLGRITVIVAPDGLNTIPTHLALMGLSAGSPQ